MGIDSLIAGLSQLREWVFGIQRNRQEREDRFDGALRSVHKALNETAAYLAFLREGGEEDQEREGRLSESWADAVVAIRQFDPNLAELWHLKSRAWADSSLWDDPRFNDPRLSLDSISAECQRLLRGD